MSLSVSLRARGAPYCRLLPLLTTRASYLPPQPLCPTPTPPLFYSSSQLFFNRVCQQIIRSERENT